MEITCNSTSSALQAHKSSDILSKFLKSKTFTDTEPEQIITIFNKIKTHSPISKEEENTLFWLFNTDTFCIHLQEYLNSQLNIPPEKSKFLNAYSFKEEAIKLIYKSRLIKMLDSTSANKEILSPYGEVWASFKKICLDEKKYLYLEFISAYKNFSIYKDIKTDKYRVINDTNQEILLDSKSEIFFQITPENVFIESIHGKHNYLLCQNNIYPFHKDSKILHSKYSTHIIDFKESLITLIDMTTGKSKLINLAPLHFLEHYENFWLLFLDPLKVKTSDTEMYSFSSWEVILYDMIQNKKITNDIHVWCHIFQENTFTYLSLDGKYIYIKNLKTDQHEKFLFENIPWYDSNKNFYENFINIYNT